MKDWLPKSVCGAEGLGRFMGREFVVKNGIALGRTLYLGHGTRAAPCEAFVFEDSDRMRQEGFEVYCADLVRRPPMEDSSELSRHTRAAGIAFVTHSAITAASNNFAKEANQRGFNCSMGRSTYAILSELNSGITFDLVLHYLELPAPEGITKVLNLEKPGASDLLSVCLKEVTNQIRARAVGFQRTGTLGFDSMAVPLAQATALAIIEAAQKYGW